MSAKDEELAPIAISKAKTESIKVVVRVRPLSDREATDPAAGSVVTVVSSTDLEVLQLDGKRTFQCAFDAALNVDSTQLDLYSTVKSCTNSVLEGFNATIFAYGQTGSGKTYSMYGPPSDTGSRLPTDFSLVGVIPRVINEVFDAANQPGCIQLSVYCSCVQIYNENLYDMLRDTSMALPLTIREDQREIYVQGLSEYNVKGVADTLALLRLADNNRAIRDTAMNMLSSRSHSIFQLYVEQKRIADDGGEVSLRAKYNLVDLAGSEKWNIMHRMREDHITEMTNINLSLHTLGRCISSLAQKAKGRDGHVPYRESKLTRLLQDSLGGNAKTILIATVSASRLNVEETISTLKFADRAKQVMVQAVVNETRPVDHALVQRLQREIEHLRELLRQFTADTKLAVTTALTAGSSSIAAISNSESSTSPLRNGDGGGAGTEALRSMLAYEQAMKREEMNAALKEEKERVAYLQKENEGLKNELWAMKSAGLPHTHGLEQLPRILANGNSLQFTISSNVKPAQPVAPPGAIILSDVQFEDTRTSVASLTTANNVMWNHFEKLQRIIKKFFKFEIEEENMKEEVEKLFRDFHTFKADQASTKTRANDLIDTLNKLANNSSISSPVPNKQSSQQSLPSSGRKRPDDYDSRTSQLPGGTVNGHHRNPSNSGNAYKSSADIRRAAASDLMDRNYNETATQSQALSSLPQGHSSADRDNERAASLSGQTKKRIGTQPTSQGLQGSASDGRLINGSQNLSAMNPSSVSGQSVQLNNDIQSHRPPRQTSNDPSAGLTITTSTRAGRYDNIATAASSGGLSATSQQQSFGVTPSISASRRQQHHQHHQQQQQQGDSLQQSYEAAVNQPISNMNLSYRMRGSGSSNIDNQTAWVESESIEEREEELLQRELKAAKKRLKKQQQLQEWMREKELKLQNAASEEEEERRAMREAEQLKEAKRKERAAKQKQKLAEYEAKIKSEADAIQELKALGIDPESLYGPKS